MQYTIEYEICLDEDYPNEIGFMTVCADNQKQAVEEFKKRRPFMAVMVGMWENV